MANDKSSFLKKVVVLIDTREQENKHVISALDDLGIKYERQKLDCGDYSFVVDGRDFSLSCAIERKGNVEELYNNIMGDRGRIEKELFASSQNKLDLTILIENCKSYEHLRSYTLTAEQMRRQPQRQVRDIGKYVYATIRAWERKNRYGFSVEFTKKEESAVKMLEVFYYFWHNYKELTGSRRGK